jgi:hypothetical protein
MATRRCGCFMTSCMGAGGLMQRDVTGFAARDLPGGVKSEEMMEK